MKKDLLIEIGVEEIPSTYMEGILDQLKTGLKDKLDEYRIEYSSFEVTGTPRRLVMRIKGVGEFQFPVKEEIKGPPAVHSFTKDGEPTEVLKGFLKKYGLREKEIKVVNTEKGKYVFGVKEIKGDRVEKVIPELLTRLLDSLSFPKSMRWNEEGRFVRPVRWILGLFGNKTISLRYRGVKGGRFTRASRAEKAKRVKILSPSEYTKVLRKHGVVVEDAKRKGEIEAYLDRLSKKKNWTFDVDESFIKSIVFSLEKPYGFHGKFAERFLTLPYEVIANVLKEQVRCLPVKNRNGKPLPVFVGFANVKPLRDVVEGYERVITARLEDALFYAEEDLKKSLDDHVEALKKIVHHEKLGSVYHKTMRIRVLVKFLKPFIYPEGDEDKVDKLALLSRFDHATLMGQEFPELRGIIGMWLGEKFGLEKEICLAIREQYLPTHPGGELPSTKAGLLLAVANRIEEIVALFYTGYRPTGSEDPFGIRRDALTLVEVLSRMVSIPLKEAIKKACDNFENVPVGLPDEIHLFIKERFRFYMQSKGIPVELIEGVMEKTEDLKETRERIEAFYKFSRESPDRAENIIVARKRIANIMEQAGGVSISTIPDEYSYLEEAEKSLIKYYKERADYIKDLLSSKKYGELFNEYVRISEMLQKFFEDVFVMVEDETLRTSRLSLLNSIGELYDIFADFRRIPTKKFGGGRNG